MTKEQALRTAEKLLLHIYGEDVMICGKICASSADNNYEYICACLDEVTGFCYKLKKVMREE